MTGHTVDEQTAHVNGYECGLCLDFGDLPSLGPCPHCSPDGFAEYLAMVAATAAHRRMP